LIFWKTSFACQASLNLAENRLAGFSKRLFQNPVGRGTGSIITLRLNRAGNAGFWDGFSEIQTRSPL
jgi:hypothetical protein